MQVVSQNKHLYAKSLNGEKLYSVKPYDGSMFCRTLGLTHSTCLTLKAWKDGWIGNINMIVKDQGSHIIKMSTLIPCDGHEDSS